MVEFELDDFGVYRNTKVFDQLFKFLKENWGNDRVILNHLEDLVSVELTGWFMRDENDEISVGIELNESSDHKYDEIIFYDKNNEDITVFSVMREPTA
ncbi:MULTISPECIES: hypothetical protein [unclassified Methanosarcina]|uniref:hypothetical protein n=1 Tax=unclassified Methanosarcina TaxID=2644672 RepID=UPI00064E5800|nr:MULTISPECIES: hypothetical protein [unclassified Methanosarcina]